MIRSVTDELVRAMMYRMVGSFFASLGVIAIMLAANAAFARSGTAPAVAVASTHPIAARSAAPSLRYRRGNGGRFYGPVLGGAFYGPSNGEPVSVTEPVSADVHYTHTYDVPWDWAHRYQPAVVPSDRPYAPSCSNEPVTVPGRGGKAQSVNVTRCY